MKFGMVSGVDAFWDAGAGMDEFGTANSRREQAVCLLFQIGNGSLGRTVQSALPTKLRTESFAAIARISSFEFRTHQPRIDNAVS